MTYLNKYCQYLSSIFYIGYQRQIQGRGGREKQSLPKQKETRTRSIWLEEGYRGSRIELAKVRTG